jgi:hypothetical protein
MMGSFAFGPGSRAWAFDEDEDFDYDDDDYDDFIPDDFTPEILMEDMNSVLTGELMPFMEMLGLSKMSPEEMERAAKAFIAETMAKKARKQKSSKPGKQGDFFEDTPE